MVKPNYYDSTVEAPPATMDTYYADISFRIIVKEIDKTGKGLAILDVGCGEGLLGSLVSEKNEVHGVDIHKEKVERCRKKGIIAELITPDAKLPYESDKFDVVTCCQVLEHLIEPYKMVSEIERVLKPGGLFAVTVPNMYDLHTRVRFLFGLTTKITYGSNLGHLRFFSKKRLAELITGARFSIYRNNSYGFACYARRPLALISYIVSFVCNPTDLKGLRLRKQKIYNSIELFLTNIFGFTSLGGDLLIFSKKISAGLNRSVKS